MALVLAASALVPSGSRLFACHQMQCRGRYSSGVVMVEQIPRPDGNAIPIRSVVLGLATVSSVFGLASDRELAGLITRMGDPTLDVNYFNTLVDSFVLSYGTNYLLNTLGILRPDLSESSKKLTLNGMECPITLNIGREPGTWMPKEWAASGARLSLPTTIRFSDEIVDLGFPGEDALDANGDRYAKKLYCEGGSFVGAQGEVKVRASGGAWNMEPSGIPGANTLNFFIDIPEAAARNECVPAQSTAIGECVSFLGRLAGLSIVCLPRISRRLRMHLLSSRTTPHTPSSLVSRARPSQRDPPSGSALLQLRVLGEQGGAAAGHPGRWGGHARRLQGRRRRGAWRRLRPQPGWRLDQA